MHDGVISARLGLRGQPSLAELSIVERDIALAEAAGAALHCCHLSTAAALDAVDRARSRGVRVTAEVTPHHLWLDHAAVAGCGEQLAYDTAAKVNPPLRTRADVDACIDALAAGVVDAVATDHAPHAAPDKHCEFDRSRLRNLRPRKRLERRRLARRGPPPHADPSARAPHDRPGRRLGARPPHDALR